MVLVNVILNVLFFSSSQEPIFLFINAIFLVGVVLFIRIVWY